MWCVRVCACVQLDAAVNTCGGQDNSQESLGLSFHLNKSRFLVLFLLTASWPESFHMILLFLRPFL